MLSAEEKERYSRQLILPGFDEQTQLKLKHASVLVVGAGGLGCPVIQSLAAAGIGSIGIIDHDTVSLSNLQRQIIFKVDDIGFKKAEVAKRYIHQANPNISVVAYDKYLDTFNSQAIIQCYDYIIDCSDNFSTRYLINDICVGFNTPFISGSIHQYTGQYAVYNWNTGPTYRCVFPEPDLMAATCSDEGVLSSSGGVIGSLMATELIKMITGCGEVIKELVDFNGITGKFSYYQIERNLESDSQLGTHYNANCFAKDIGISVSSNISDYKMVDVREDYEIETSAGLNIPFGEVAEKADSFSVADTIIFVCDKGVRSKAAAMFYRSKGFNNAYYLKTEN